MTHWHPLFAKLLRPLLENHYEVQTNVPVGDAPRLADVLLLRRTSTGTPPFRGLWRRLTTWNVLEFKGPTVSARVDDLDSLLEVGLGIQRRLNEERARLRQPALGREEVSFWYMANHLGRRFLGTASALVGPLEQDAEGVWRGIVWQRPLLLVSNRAVAVERDSLPLHLLTPEPETMQRTVEELMSRHPDLGQVYGVWLASLQPTVVKELLRMGRRKSRGLTLNVGPVIRYLGWKEVLRQIGQDELIAEGGLQAIIDQVGLDNLVSQLNAEQREELFRLLQEPPQGERAKRKK
jgi:hypothetical protein